jgi:hypothetical protein
MQVLFSAVHNGTGTAAARSAYGYFVGRHRRNICAYGYWVVQNLSAGQPLLLDTFTPMLQVQD